MLSCRCASFGATLPNPRHCEARSAVAIQRARSALVNVLDCHGPSALRMTGWGVKNPLRVLKNLFCVLKNALCVLSLSLILLT
jgi:hypothetical protein